MRTRISCLFLVSVFSLILQSTICFSQFSKATDSVAFDLPFTAYDFPFISMNIEGDSLYLVNHFGSEFYILSIDWKISTRYQVNSALKRNINLFPLLFSYSKNSFQFWEGARVLLFDKQLKNPQCYWMRDTLLPRDLGQFLHSCFYSEKNNRFYYTANGGGYLDTTRIDPLTPAFYSHPFLSSFSLNNFAKPDTFLVRRVFEDSAILYRPPPFRMTDKFLPHLDFRDVKFDEEKQRIYVSDAVDSQIQVYDLKGSWKQSFGVKGKNMPQQPYEFVKHFDLDKYVHQNRSFVYFLDSLNFCSSYYYRMVANHDFSLIARNYLVPDSVKIVPGNEVGYSTSLLHQNSVLKIKKYVQIYKHRKLIVDENVPYTWVMIGFWQDKLLFYRLEHIEDSERYILHLYKIEI